MKKLIEIFLGSEDLREMKKKGLSMSYLVPSVWILDFVMVGITGVLVAFLQKYMELGYVYIFSILFFGNMIISGAVVYWNSKTETDITMMEGLRRLINFLIEKKLFLGIVVEVIIFFRLLIWDGPDQFIVFFGYRLKSKFSKVAIFTTASFCQMAIWTYAYMKGVESFWDIFL